MPGNVRRYLDGENRNIYGGFLACPFTTEKPGWMQFVCIQRTENLVIEDLPHPPIMETVGYFAIIP
jgi:hypothetical protein